MGKTAKYKLWQRAEDAGEQYAEFVLKCSVCEKPMMKEASVESWSAQLQDELWYAYEQHKDSVGCTYLKVDCDRTVPVWCSVYDKGSNTMVTLDDPMPKLPDAQTSKPRQYRADGVTSKSSSSCGAKPTVAALFGHKVEPKSSNLPLPPPPPVPWTESGSGSSSKRSLPPPPPAPSDEPSYKRRR